MNKTNTIAEDETRLFIYFPPFFMLSWYSMAKPKFMWLYIAYLLHELIFFAIIIFELGGIKWRKNIY